MEPGQGGQGKGEDVQQVSGARPYSGDGPRTCLRQKESGNAETERGGRERGDKAERKKTGQGGRREGREGGREEKKRGDRSGREGKGQREDPSLAKAHVFSAGRHSHGRKDEVALEGSWEQLPNASSSCEPRQATSPES